MARSGWHDYDADPTGGDPDLVDDPMWSPLEVPKPRPAQDGELCWECGQPAVVTYVFRWGPRGSVPWCRSHVPGTDPLG